MDEEALRKGRRTRQILVIVLLVVFVALGFLLSDRLVEIVADPASFKVWMQERGMVGILAFAGLSMIQVVLAVVPGGPFSLTAGYVFGPLRGTLLCIFAATIASVFVFLLVKRFGKRLVAVFVSDAQMALLERYEENEAYEKKIERMLILIFIMPGTPKDPLTYLAGLTKIPVWKWFLVSLIGRFPGAYLSALGGSAFGSGKATIVIAAVGGLVVLGIIGKMMRGMINEMNREE